MTKRFWITGLLTVLCAGLLSAYTYNGSLTFINAILSGYAEMVEISDPSNPSANGLRLYSNDVGGATHLMMRDSAGTETDLTAGGGGGNFYKSWSVGQERSDSTASWANLGAHCGGTNGPTGGTYDSNSDHGYAGERMSGDGTGIETCAYWMMIPPGLDLTSVTFSTAAIVAATPDSGETIVTYYGWNCISANDDSEPASVQGSITASIVVTGYTGGDLGTDIDGTGDATDDISGSCAAYDLLQIYGGRDPTNGSDNYDEAGDDWVPISFAVTIPES